jgi:hypothetical protein
MRYLLCLLMTLPLFAQEAPPQGGTTPAAAETPAAAPAEKPAEPPAAVPAPSEQPYDLGPVELLNGGVEFGYRFRAGVRGSMETFRSIVNLNKGPRLFGVDFTLGDNTGNAGYLFDRLEASAHGWGDPQNTARVRAFKRGIYDFRLDYRNIIYYNALPSFANVTPPGGYTEHAYDVHRRMAGFSLDLLPGRRVTPYLGYDRDSGFGSGVSTWVLSGNEYAVPTTFRDHTDNYRGGLRFQFRRLHATLEQGGVVYKNDDSVYDFTTRLGNRTAPFVGQNLQLTTLLQAYGIRGRNIYERGFLTASPASWLDISGQFLYSRPKNDVNYSAIAQGTLAQTATLTFYTAQIDALTGLVNRPHVSGNLAFEMRPFKRLRVIESWMTDRYHDSAFASLASAILLTPASTPSVSGEQTRDLLVVNLNRNQTDLFLDVTSRITLRGGYRYEWGDATVRASTLNQSGPQEKSTLSRQVGIGGINFRPFQRLTLNAEYEGASTARAYFKTSLYNYRRMRARARWQAATSLSLQANLTLLDNDNPVPGILNDFRSRDNALSLNWTPAGGKYVAFMAQYDRATLRSRANYLNLPFLTPAISSYRDDAHLATAAFTFGIPGLANGPKLTAGGSMSINNGTRTSRYYQPMARLAVPFGRHVTWNSEWQYYGFDESLFAFERFRTHLFQTGLRLSR